MCGVYTGDHTVHIATVVNNCDFKMKEKYANYCACVCVCLLVSECVCACVIVCEWVCMGVCMRLCVYV